MLAAKSTRKDRPLDETWIRMPAEVDNGQFGPLSGQIAACASQRDIPFI